MIARMSGALDQPQISALSVKINHSNTDSWISGLVSKSALSILSL